MPIQSHYKTHFEGTDTVYLSARVPVGLKNRFKALAAERGEKVQDLLQEIVQSYVEQETRAPLAATDIILSLRQRREELEGQGIGHLYLFGSHARGDGRPDSDIDLSYEPREGAQLSLFDLGRLKDLLETTLESPGCIDLVPRDQLAAHVAETVVRDEIRVF